MNDTIQYTVDRDGIALLTIDLDIIFYGGLVLKTPELTIPHARVAERRFVLEPLSEIAPCWRHPITHGTAAEMLSRINGK